MVEWLRGERGLTNGGVAERRERTNKWWSGWEDRED